MSDDVFLFEEKWPLVTLPPFSRSMMLKIFISKELEALKTSGLFFPDWNRARRELETGIKLFKLANGEFLPFPRRLAQIQNYRPWSKFFTRLASHLLRHPEIKFDGSSFQEIVDQKIEFDEEDGQDRQPTLETEVLIIIDELLYITPSRMAKVALDFLSTKYKYRVIRITEQEYSWYLKEQPDSMVVNTREGFYRVESS